MKSGDDLVLKVAIRGKDNAVLKSIKVQIPKKMKVREVRDMLLKKASRHLLDNDGAGYVLYTTGTVPRCRMDGQQHARRGTSATGR